MKNELALYQCLNIIRTSDQMEPLRRWLKDQREASRDRLETLSGDALHIEQGSARTYKSLYELIENAPKFLEKIESK
jgi:hypothetical protein